MNKLEKRKRRGLKTKKIQQDSIRLVVFRSNSHMEAQLVTSSEFGDKVLVFASTKDKTLRANLAKTKVEQAKQVGQLLAEKAKTLEEQMQERISFDRSGYKYHGRVKAVAEGAREAGLNF